MLRVVVGVVALMSAAGAVAQSQQAESGRPPQRIRNVTVTGQQACPQSTADEVVVCSRLDGWPFSWAGCSHTGSRPQVTFASRTCASPA